jgi:phage shock protein A
MSEEIAEVRNALIEAVTSQKLIKEKLDKSKGELETWRKRLAITQKTGPDDVEKEVTDRIRSLELLIAELEADLMSQEDLEKQLKVTLSKLEHNVNIPPPPSMPDFDDGEETLQRLEGKIFEKEALAELSAKDDERKFERESKSLSLDAELEALKKAMKQKKEES